MLLRTPPRTILKLSDDAFIEDPAASRLEMSPKQNPSFVRVERIVRRRQTIDSLARPLLERHFQHNSITMLQRAYSA